MAQVAVRSPLYEDSGENGISSPHGMGTFFVSEEAVRMPKRQGPVFVKRPAHGGPAPKISDIRIGTRISPEILETFDAHRLAGLLAEEAILLGGTHEKHAKDDIAKNLRQALYILDPKKYYFLAPPANDSKYTETKSLKNSLTQKEKKIPLHVVKKVEPVEEKIETTVQRPKRKALQRIRGDLNSLGIAPPPKPKMPLPHPLLSRVRPPTSKVINEVAPRRKMEVSKTQEKVSPEVIKEAKHTETAHEKKEKLEIVTGLLQVLFKDETDPTQLAAPLKGLISREATPTEKAVHAGLPVVETLSWKDELEGPLKVLAEDIMKLRSDELLSKYMGLDKSASNVSLISNAEKADTYDVLHNPDEDKYFKREELSRLIVDMKKIAECAGITLHIVQGPQPFTIHMLYDQLRTIITNRS